VVKLGIWPVFREHRNLGVNRLYQPRTTDDVVSDADAAEASRVDAVAELVADGIRAKDRVVTRPAIGCKPGRLFASEPLTRFLANRSCATPYTIHLPILPVALTAATSSTVSCAFGATPAETTALPRSAAGQASVPPVPPAVGEGGGRRSRNVGREQESEGPIGAPSGPCRNDAPHHATSTKMDSSVLEGLNRSVWVRKGFDE
jgi:hypothetical protein